MSNRVLGAVALSLATAASASPVTVEFTGSMAGIYSVDTVDAAFTADFEGLEIRQA